MDADGNLSAVTPEAKKLLGGWAGRYVLAPTSPDLLCLVREPPAGMKAPTPRVVLTGEVGAFGMADLLAFFGQSRWSGVFRVRTASADRSIFLREGEVCGATSDDPSDRIGEVLVRLGHVERSSIEAVLRETAPARLGRVLVEKGLLQSHELFKCLTHQVSEIFHALVLARDGLFFVVEQPTDEKSLHTLRLSVQSLLMDSIRKIDELAHFRKRIPHGRVYVASKREADEALEAEEQLVLSLCDGRHTLLELGQAAKLSEFDATRVVYRLLEGGYAQIAEGASGASSHAAQAAPKGKDAREAVRVFNFIFREVRDEVAKQKMERTFVAAANAALTGQALTASPVLQGLMLSEEGMLDEDELMRRYEARKGELGAEPQAALKQALSEIMFFLLFQAGELLELKADEDLARRVKQLLATLD